MVAIFTGAGTGFERGSGNVVGGSGLLGSAAQGRSGEQVMVNAATGNLMITQRDEFLVGRGPDVAVSRTYNSQGDLSDDNGDNWRMSNERAPRDLIGTLNTEGSTVKRMSADGSLITYTWNGAAYSANDGAGAYDTLTNTAGIWRWVDGDSRVTEVYGGPGGRISQASDTSGNALTYIYAGTQLSEIRTTTGDSVRYTWSGNNLAELTTSYTPAEPDATYAKQIYRLYDAAFDRAPDPGGFGDMLDGMRSGLTITQLGEAFYASGEYAARGTHALSNADYVEFVYQSVLRRASDAGGKAAHVAALNAGASRGIMLANFSETLEHIAVTASMPSRIAPAQLQRTHTRYAYDGHDRLQSVTVDLSPGDNNPLAGARYTTIYSYVGSSKLVTSIVQADGSRIEIGYDGSNRVTSLVQTVAEGVSRTSTIQYLANETVITDPLSEETRLYYDASGALTAIVTPAPAAGATAQTVAFAYNGRGDLTSVTDASGESATYVYDPRGNVTVTIDRLGNAVRRVFDAANQLLVESRDGSDAVSSQARHSTRYAYDDKNRLRFIVTDSVVSADGTIQDGGVTQYNYDGFGQILTTYVYTAVTYDTTPLNWDAPVEYQALVNWSQTVDKSSAQVVRASYSQRGDLANQLTYGDTAADGTSLTTNSFTHTNFTYDEAGRMLSRYSAGMQRREYMAYDAMGRLIVSTDAAGAATRFVFNDAATKTIVTLASGAVQTSTYNKAGELIAQLDTGARSAAAATAHQYDGLGRLRSTTDAAGQTTYFIYDRAGRKVAEVNQAGWMVSYRYDTNDRLVATVRHANIVGAQQMLDVANVAITPDLASVRPPSHLHDQSTWTFYDAEGRVVQTTEGNGSTTRYGYDKSSNVIRTTKYHDPLTPAQIATISASAIPQIETPAGVSSFTRYFYDSSGRMIGSLNELGYLRRIGFDKAGQKIHEQTFDRAVAADLRGQATLEALTADVGGTNAASITRYIYDGQGHLRFVIDALGGITGYRYEVFGTPYTAYGPVRQVIDYAGTIASIPYTLDGIKQALEHAGLTNHVGNRIRHSVYDAAGRLGYAIDAAGGVTQYRYDISGNVIRTTQFATIRPSVILPEYVAMENFAINNASNASNRVTRNYYNARGELSYVIDPEGYVTANTYNGTGQRTAIIRWDNPVAALDTWTIDTVVAQAVGPWSRETFEYGLNGLMWRAVNAVGNEHEYRYYANGRLMEDIVSPGTNDERRTYRIYDAAGQLVEQRDAHGEAEQLTTRYAYDGRGNIISIIDPGDRVTTRQYDRVGRLIRETDPLNKTTNYEYDALGNRTVVIDGRGSETHNYYDKLGRVIVTRDAEDYVTETTYTVFGDIRTTTRHGARTTSPRTALALPVLPPVSLPATTWFEYDRLGNVTKVIDAESKAESTSYNAFGQVQQTINKAGGVRDIAYYRTGDTYWEKTLLAVSDAEGASATINVFDKLYVYGARGNLTETYEAYGHVSQRKTIYFYDKADRLIEKRSDAVGVVLPSNHIALINVVPTERYSYDSHNNLTQVIDANGGRTLFYYDKLDRKIAEINAVGMQTRFYYDVNGNLRRTRVWETATPLPNNPASLGNPNPPGPGTGPYRETATIHNALGLLVSTSMSGLTTGKWVGTNQSNPAIGMFVTSAAPVETIYEYDATGNLVKTTDARGGIILYYYDKLGRKTAQVDQNSFLTKWVLDTNGNALSETRFATPVTGAAVGAEPIGAPNAADRTTTFEYDLNGRRVKETRLAVQAWKLNALGGLDGDTGDTSITYRYNALGQVTERREMTGDAVAYEYDAYGRMTKETRAAYNYNDGQVSSLVTPTLRYFYNAAGDLVRTQQGDATAAVTDRVTRYYYRAGGRLTQTIDATNGSKVYYYDALGNVLRNDYGRLLPNGTAAPEAILYTRDILGRVTEQTVAKLSGSTWIKGDLQQTEYTATGEVARSGINGGWQDAFAYDTAGRLRFSRAGDGVARHFIYDATGNRTLALESEGTQLGGMSLVEAVAIATNNGAWSLGAQAVDGVNVTVEIFDARGQSTATWRPKRELGAGAGSPDLWLRQGYNAFGETAFTQDARNFATNYSYNTMGRLTVKTGPSILWTETIFADTGRPEEFYFWDRSGRAIGSRDANYNLKTRNLIAGTGYGETAALVSLERNPDGGQIAAHFDVFGDLRRSVDPMGRVTAMEYDGAGRLTKASRPGGFTDNYAYDIHGQRIRHWTSGRIAGDEEHTLYDRQGRVIETRAFGGDVTMTSYAWNGGAITEGLGTFGGWNAVTTHANGRTSSELSDVSGRTLSVTDMGGRVTYSAYDAAGRLTQTTGPETISYSWLNSGWLASVTTGTGSRLAANDPNHAQSYRLTTMRYAYDADGRKTLEREDRERGYWVRTDVPDGEPGIYYTTWAFAVDTTALKYATASYDAAGRMTHWAEAGVAGIPAASVDYRYDAAGNVRSEVVLSGTLDAFGGAVGAANPVPVERWYLYDAMNRMTRSGVLLGGSVVRDAQGIDILYRADGQRASTDRTETRTEGYDTRTGTTREYYGYYGTGQLENLWRASFTFLAGGGVSTPGPAPNYAERDTIQTEQYHQQSYYAYDALGRLAQQVDYSAKDVAAYIRRGDGDADWISYDGAGRVTHDVVTTVKPDGLGLVTTTDYAYAGAQGYMLGSLVGSTATTRVLAGGPLNTVTTTNTYDWYDGAALTGTSVATDNADAQTPDTYHTTTHALSATGAVTTATIADGRPRQVSFVHDATGRIVRRDEADSNTASGDPHALWYRFDGREIGVIGNDGATDASYDASVDTRRTTPGAGPFRGGAASGVGYARFGQGFDTLSSFAQGADGGRYTVQSGDTLASIAQALWGDANLWYKLAQANGLGADSTLIAAQLLTIPAGVMRTANSATSTRPYDAADLLGDISPSTPAPQATTGGAKKNKCGAFGAVLLVAVAVAVTIATKGVGAKLAAAIIGGSKSAAGAVILGGALAGAAGSVVSQGVGLATGIQDKFSFKGVALAALGGGVGAGIGKIGFLNGASGALGAAQDVARGALGNLATQGVAVATSLQSKFDWTGVAVGAVVGGLIGLANRTLAANGVGVRADAIDASTSRNIGFYANQALSGMAGAIAGGTARSLVDGSSFGDNVLAALPDVIGATIGNALVDRIAGYPALMRKTPPKLADPIGLLNDDAVSVGTTSSPTGRPATDVVGQTGAISAGSEGQMPYTVLDDVVSTAVRASGREYMLPRERQFGDLLTLQIERGRVEDVNAHYRARSGMNYADYDVTIEAYAATEQALNDRGLVADAAVSDLLKDFGVEYGKTALLEAVGLGVAKLAAPLIRPVVGKVGTLIANRFGKVAETVTARAGRLGREGEAAVGITGPKIGVKINGQIRFPDELSPNLLKEVKNVARQGWTRQLRDYADLAQQRGIPFQLYVREPLHPSGETILTVPLKNAVKSGAVRLQFIPGTF